MPVLDISVVIDSQAITAFGVMVVAVIGAYGALQQRQVAKRVEEVAIARRDDSALAADTNAVTHEVHTLTNSGMTDIKEQLAKQQAKTEELQIALATANERLKTGPEREDPSGTYG